MNKKTPALRKFGNDVHQLRIQKGLSQEQLAHLANVHRTYTGMIERTEKNITLINITKIANAPNRNLIDLSKND